MEQHAEQNTMSAAEKLASKIAHVQLTKNDSMGTIFGSRMYRVKGGWEAEQLKSERSAAQVISVMQLREAMENTQIESIFIPAQNTLTLDAAKTVLEQSSQDKTLFWEA